MRLGGRPWLLFGALSAVWSISLHRKSSIAYPHFYSDSRDEPAPGPNTLLNNWTNSAESARNDNSSNNTKIETVLIIATVPYTSEQVMALWTHLECITDGIDRVLISAPDTDWSREIIGSVVQKFNQLLRESGNKQAISIEAAYYTNNRYDVGLWCDGLRSHLGFNGDAFPDSDSVDRAIFLINDSGIALRNYESLTNKIVVAAQIDRRNQNEEGEGGNSVQVVSLNGHLLKPGEAKYYFVESVYRGLTPRAVSTFYKHSCTPDAERVCVGLTGNQKKTCIVNRYEISLSNSFRPLEVDAMYPSYLPKEWDAKAWEGENGPIKPMDQWRNMKKYFRYLVDVHDFPFRKLKWPGYGYPHKPPKSHCLELFGGEPWFKAFHEQLPFPSTTAFEEFQAEMVKSESTLGDPPTHLDLKGLMNTKVS